MSRTRSGAAGCQRLESWTGRFDLYREGARGAAMSRTDTLLTMPSIRSDRDRFRVRWGPDRSAGSQGSARDQACPAAGVGSPARAGGRRQSARNGGCAAKSASRAALCWRWRPSSPPARWVGRAAPAGSSPARSPKRRRQTSASSRSPVRATRAGTAGSCPRSIRRRGRTLDRTGGDGPGHRHGGSRGLPRLCVARRQPRGLHA